MVTIGKTFAMPVSKLSSAVTLNWGVLQLVTNQILMYPEATTSWYSMSTIPNTNFDRYYANAWDHTAHDFYLKLDYLNRNKVNLVWLFKAGCHRCDDYAAKRSKKLYMYVMPIFKKVFHANEALQYTEKEYVNPLYQELNELHCVIDNLYVEDRQQHKYKIKF